MKTRGKSQIVAVVVMMFWSSKTLTKSKSSDVLAKITFTGWLFIYFKTFIIGVPDPIQPLTIKI